MPNRSAERGAGINILAAVAVLLLLAGGVAWQSATVVAFFKMSVQLNTVILAVLAVGALYAAYWLARLQREFYALESARAGFLTHPNAPVTPQSIAPLAPSLTHERLALYLEQLRHSRPPNGDSHSEKVSMTLALHTGVTRYVAGLLVFLGLLGTFIGLLMSLHEIDGLIKSIQPEAAGDRLSFLAALQTQLGGPLKGMSTAFSTSVFGLVASLFMGFVHLQLASAQTRFIARFELLDSTLFLPALADAAGVALPVRAGAAAAAGPAGGGIDETIARYIEASQRQLKENLDRLMGIVERTESMQANFREVLMTIGAEIETTNTAIGRLSTNQDLVRDAMGKLVDLTRSGDESQRLMVSELKTISDTLARMTAAQQSIQSGAQDFHGDVLRLLRQETGAWQKAGAIRAANRAIG